LLGEPQCLVVTARAAQQREVFEQDRRQPRMRCHQVTVHRLRFRNATFLQQSPRPGQQTIRGIRWKDPELAVENMARMYRPAGMR
jgi:hypothetical protein